MFDFNNIKTMLKMAPEGNLGLSAGAGAVTQGLTGAISKGGTGGLKSPSPWGMVGAAADTIGGFMPLKTEYAGDKGAITAGMDSAYDKISDGLMSIPVWGTVAGGIMKAGALAGKGMNALGGGTDGMTTADAILGSSFFNMTPLGLINGFGGSKTDTMSKDYETLALVGSSYGSTYTDIDSAVNKSGKKYGLLSQGAKRDANELIYAAGRNLNILKYMAQNKSMNLEVLNNLMDSLSTLYAQNINGGIDIATLRAAKRGDKLFSKEQLQRVQKIKSRKQGGTIKKSLYVFNLDAFKQIEEPETTIGEFKQGGTFEFNLSAFKQGGQMNVIPEGALHARKHDMFEESPELKGQITEKGIPVVIEKDGGEVEQQAEIEVNEIIFNKEVTTKLEEYFKKYKETEDDSYTIKAGKLIAKEIMENTDDRTNLINTI